MAYFNFANPKGLKVAPNDGKNEEDRGKEDKRGEGTFL